MTRKVYRTRAQARADVFDYIERFYNPARRHSTLGYVRPLVFEKAGIGNSPLPAAPHCDAS
jgi:putative transposase